MPTMVAKARRRVSRRHADEVTEAEMQALRGREAQHYFGILGPGAAAGRAELNTAHLPTGPVALRDVVGLAIRDFGVTPLRHDWQAALAAPERTPPAVLSADPACMSAPTV
jgi:hypothetical protein